MNANLNALQKLGLMGASKPPQNENNVSSNNGGNMSIQNNKPKEIPNSQMSGVSGFSQDLFKEGGSANPFSGLRSQLQNLRQKASNLNPNPGFKDSPPSSQFKENNAFIPEPNPPKPNNPFNSRLGAFLGNNNNQNSGILKPTSIQSSQNNPINNELGLKLGLFTQFSNKAAPPVQQQPKINNDFDDFEDLDDIAELIEKAEMEMEIQKELEKGKPGDDRPFTKEKPSQMEPEDERPFTKANPNQNPEFSFDFDSFMTQNKLVPQEKKVKHLGDELNNEEERHFIDLSQTTKSQKFTRVNIFTQQALKKERIETEAEAEEEVMEIKYEKSQVYRRPTPSPLFKVKQQLHGKNPKLINLGASESWKKGLNHLGINAPGMLGEEVNERVNNSLNELNFITIAQIKSNICINLKAPNILVTLKSVEIHKDTATLVLMDLTGEITGSIIKSIVTEEVNNSIYAATAENDSSQIQMNSASSYKPGEKIGLKVGMVFWFKNVTVFNPMEDTFYLTFCQKNIEQVFYE